MITPLFLSKPMQGIKKKKLVLLDDWYRQLLPYFKIKGEPQVSGTVNSPVKDQTSQSKRMDMQLQIEENQILYSKLMTQKLMKIIS